MAKAGAFEQHLVEAIAINRARRSYYAEVSGGISRWVSWSLVGAERALLRQASEIDQRARPFQSMGIPVVAADFVAMDALAPASRPPRHREEAKTWARHLSKDHIQALKGRASDALRGNAFENIAAACMHSLEELEALELEAKAHYAMSLHLVESLGYAAWHAVKYVSREPTVISLCQDFVKLQLSGLHAGPRIDHLAQKCHRRGAGIVYNDVPTIPFREEFARGLGN